LKRFLLINFGEAQDKRYQLFEPEGRVLISPGASLRFIKKRFRTSEKGNSLLRTNKGFLREVPCAQKKED
jgi:hypothetical protein